MIPMLRLQKELYVRFLDLSSINSVCEQLVLASLPEKVVLASLEFITMETKFLQC